MYSGDIKAEMLKSKPMARRRLNQTLTLTLEEHLKRLSLLVHHLLQELLLTHNNLKLVDCVIAH